MSLPLRDIRVVDLGQVYAAPYCTLQLAYLGADIIKVEPPGTGEYLRMLPSSPGGTNYNFLMLNANKKSVTLNLKHPRGREILLRLLEGADVLVENFVTGVMEDLGMGYEQLAARYPRLIYASGKGYGSDSRWARLGAMDFTVQASAALMSVTGYPDRPGVKTSATFIDMGTGSHLATGILAALLDRERTGRGQKIEVAMYDTCVPALTSVLAPVLEGKQVNRLGNRHWGICPGNVYPAADGDISIFCLTEPHWRTMTSILGREDLLCDPHYQNRASRLAIADEVDALMTQWTRARKRDEMVEALMVGGIPCAPVRTVEEVAADPEVTDRGMLRTVDFPGRGPIRVLGSPVRMSEDAHGGIPVRRPPTVGEHTAEVLDSIGIDAGELERLRQDGVI